MIKNIIKLVLKYVPRPILIAISYALKPILPFLLYGTKYKDPIDGKTFSKFLPYGYENPRDNVLSPSTFSLERHRLLWLYLKNETNLFNSKLKLLHFAPEQAFFTRFKKLKLLEYTTTDLNSPIAEVKADICDLPFKDNTYDFILCNHVLEHIPDDKKAMQELYRVLKPNGIAILQVPLAIDRNKTYEDPSVTTPKERALKFGQYDHVRIYGKDYFDRLRTIGFNVKEVDYTKNFTTEEIEKYRLDKGEIIPVCIK